MPRGIKNWTFKDVSRFLKENGFVLRYVKGSHYYYTKKDGESSYQVCVPFHGTQAIKPRTMKGIIAQSGISQKRWIR